MRHFRRLSRADEIGPGAVYEVECPDCRRSHWMVVLGPDVTLGICSSHLRQDRPCPRQYARRVAGCRGKQVCFEAALKEGRLYVLTDEGLAERGVDRLERVTRCM